MITVKATSEGLRGDKTASGYVIEDSVPFVALPSEKSLRRAVRVTNPLNGREVDALVLDVGPWYRNDDAYVEGGARPLAETGYSASGARTKYPYAPPSFLRITPTPDSRILALVCSRVFSAVSFSCSGVSFSAYGFARFARDFLDLFMVLKVTFSGQLC